MMAELKATMTSIRMEIYLRSWLFLTKLFHLAQ